jgi:flagellar protein FliT
MTDHQDPLGAYRALERACREMLDAARAGDWDEVARIEAYTRGPIDAIRACGAGAPMPRETLREKFALLRRIVQLDAQIRHLAHPWQRDLDRMLSPGAGSGDLRSAGA